MKILRAANLGSNFTDYYKKECINSPYFFYNIEFVNSITVSAHKMFKHALKTGSYMFCNCLHEVFTTSCWYGLCEVFKISITDISKKSKSICGKPISVKSPFLMKLYVKILKGDEILNCGEFGHSHLY